MYKPKVFIIILNYNTASDTIECIRSLQCLTYPAFSIVLVDNGSIDESERILKQEFPGLPFIQTGNNLGFAGGNNPGIKYALDNGAELVWILNNDTIVHPDSLTEMVTFLQSDSAIGMVGSKIYFYAEPETLWYAGGTFDDTKGGITSHLGWGRKDTGQFDHVTDVDYITGCSLLVKREVIEKVGLMPEEYFLYFEETDWNYAARKAGYRTVIATKAKIWHKVKRKGEAQVRFIYYMTRNRFLLMKKINPSGLRACMKYQYAEGKKLLKEFWIKKEYGKFTRFTKILLLAWVHGLITSRTGQVKVNTQ